MPHATSGFPAGRFYVSSRIQIRHAAKIEKAFRSAPLVMGDCVRAPDIADHPVERQWTRRGTLDFPFLFFKPECDCAAKTRVRKIRTAYAISKQNPCGFLPGIVFPFVSLSIVLSLWLAEGVFHSAAHRALCDTAHLGAAKRVGAR